MDIFFSFLILVVPKFHSVVQTYSTSSLFRINWFLLGIQEWVGFIFKVVLSFIILLKNRSQAHECIAYFWPQLDNKDSDIAIVCHNWTSYKEKFGGTSGGKQTFSCFSNKAIWNIGWVGSLLPEEGALERIAKDG